MVVELGARCQPELVGSIIDTVNGCHMNFAVLEASKLYHLVLQRLDFLQILFDVIPYPILSAFPPPSKLMLSVVCKKCYNVDVKEV